LRTLRDSGAAPRLGEMAVTLLNGSL